MLTCAMCDRVIRECCDIFFEAVDAEGRDCVLCGECAAKVEADACDRHKCREQSCEGQECPQQKEDK